MLWADTHELTDVAHLFEAIGVVDGGCALALGDETREHGNCRCLSGTIVAKQGENLAVVHLDIEALHSLEATRERLLQVFYA